MVVVVAVDEDTSQTSGVTMILVCFLTSLGRATDDFRHGGVKRIEPLSSSVSCINGNQKAEMRKRDPLQYCFRGKI